MTDVLTQATTLGFPVITDAATALDPVAARMLAGHENAVALTFTGTVLEVVLDHLPTAAGIRALERSSGCEIAVAVADHHVFTQLRARALDPGQVPAVVDILMSLPANVTQVLLRPGAPVAVGTLQAVNAVPGTPALSVADVEEAALWLAGEYHERVVPFAGRRWRVSVSTANGSPVVSLRQVIERSAGTSMTDLGLPSALTKVADLTTGLVLVASAPRGGRSATLNALADRIATSRSTWITRIVDADEYDAPDRRSQVTTRVIGVDAPSAADAIAVAMRDSTAVLVLDVAALDDADVIAATRAALAGMLVLASVPAPSVADAVAQWMLPVPAHARPAVFAALAGAWRLGAAQQLLAGRDGVPVPAVELWWTTPAMVAALHDGDLLSLRAASYDTPTDGLRNTDMEAAVAALVSGGRVPATGSA